MSELTSTLRNVIEWLQIPSIPLAVIMGMVAAYFIMAGARNSQVGKGILIAAVIGLVIVQGSNVMIESFSDQVTF